jgi:cyclic pyranopterin phosphate synthase
VSFIGANKVFAHIDRLAKWRAGETPSPVMVEIDLTSVCSLKCFGCHMAHTHTAGPWALTPVAKPAEYSDVGRLADVEVLERALGEMKAAGVQAIVFSGGGEPTLHPYFDRIVATAASLGFQLGMYTLGGHITQERAAFIREHFSWVVISLDCPDAEIYAQEKGVSGARFHAACAGAHLLTGGTCVVGISFLLHAGNHSRVYDMLALSRKLNATYATFRPTIDVSMDAPGVPSSDRAWVTDALPDLRVLQREADVEVDPDRFVEYRDWTGHGYSACLGIRLVTQITPDGRVWVCPNRRGMVGSELGDLTRESFTDIWARHPGQWQDFRECRVMCRLHLVNRALDVIERPMPHEAFV